MKRRMFDFWIARESQKKRMTLAKCAFYENAWFCSGIIVARNNVSPNPTLGKESVFALRNFCETHVFVLSEWWRRGREKLKKVPRHIGTDLGCQVTTGGWVALGELTTKVRIFQGVEYAMFACLVVANDSCAFDLIGAQWIIMRKDGSLDEEDSNPSGIRCRQGYSFGAVDTSGAILGQLNSGSSAEAFG